MREYYDGYWNRDEPPPTHDPLAETRAKILFNLVDALDPAPNSFLDVGCGEGWLVGRAQSKGMESMGIDISPAIIERAREHYPEAKFDVQEIGMGTWPVESEALDVASSFEVIEHLMDPTELIIGMRDALRVGGYAAITTPYHGLIKNIAIALRGFDKHYSVTGDHIRFFSDQALRQLLESNGFKVEKLIHYGRAPFLWAGVLAWAEKQ